MTLKKHLAAATLAIVIVVLLNGCGIELRFNHYGTSELDNHQMTPGMLKAHAVRQ